MASGARNGRASASYTWESIRDYVVGEKDKHAEFSMETLKLSTGKEYNPSSLFRLANRNVIKAVRKDYLYPSRPVNVYTLGERILMMDLADIAKMSYQGAIAKNRWS
jgi:hypothetical protein